MKTHLIILLLLLPAIAGAQEKYERRYENGRLEMTGFENKKTGRPEGHWTVYARDGKKIKECNYNDGLLEGTLYLYNIHGKVSTITEYHQGRRNGSHVEYHFFYNDSTRQVVRKRCTYHDDLEEGMCYEYDEHGQLTRKSRMKQGFPITDTVYTAEGIKYMAYRHPEEEHRQSWGDHDDWDIKFVPYHPQQQAASSAQPARQGTGTAPHRRTVKQARPGKPATPRRKAVKKPAEPKKRLKINENGVIEYS